MHRKFMPADAPDPDVEFGVAPEQITTEVLELCKELLYQASPVVLGELRQFLTANGYEGGLGGFLDVLGLTAVKPPTPQS